MKTVTDRAGPGRDVRKFDGPGRAGSGCENVKCGGVRRAAAHPLKFRWAGLGRGPCRLCMGRSARPIRWPMYFAGPGRAAPHEMWCATATTTTTTMSTLPMRPPTCLTGRPGPWPMRCGVLLLHLRLYLGVPGSLSAKKQLRSYDAFLANRRGCTTQYDALYKCRIRVLLPLWAHRRRSLPSRGCRQHGPLALVRPADGTAVATS